MLYALAAFVFWGMVPFYFKALQHVAPLEILCHRVAWSVPFTALLITLSRDWEALLKAGANRRVRGTLFFSATIVAANWFIYIYAIITDRLLQASLGYFINPLVNVLLGIIFLRERLRPLQVLAVFFVAGGALNLTITYGELPWISLTLAFSFGFYGLLRKTVLIESVNGLFVETSLLFPFAVGYLLFRTAKGVGAFGVTDWQTTTLLALAGVVTSVPLVWFTSAARRLQYTTLGIIQYIAPSLQFLLAVLYYKEPFTRVYLITFVSIWAGLAIFISDSLSLQRKNPRRS